MEGAVAQVQSLLVLVACQVVVRKRPDIDNVVGLIVLFFLVCAECFDMFIGFIQLIVVYMVADAVAFQQHEVVVEGLLHRGYLLHHLVELFPQLYQVGLHLLVAIHLIQIGENQFEHHDFPCHGRVLLEEVVCFV